MSKVIVRKALETALANFVSTQYPEIAVSWENQFFDPSLISEFIKPELLPAGVLNPSLGDNHFREYGSFMVTILSDNMNTGTRRLDTISDDLVDAFPRGLALPMDGLVVYVGRTPFSHYVDVVDSWLTILVEIPYYCDTIK